MILVSFGICAFQRWWLRTILIAIVLVSELAGCHFYFYSWQKGNAKQAISYACHLKTKDAVVVRPAYFSDLYRFYDAGIHVPVLDEHTLDDEDKRAELKGRKIILLAFHVQKDEVGNALLTKFKVVSAQPFPSPIPLHGITVYELRLSFPKIRSRLKLLHLQDSVDSLPTMNAALASIVSTLFVAFRSRLALQAEILALRHQLNVLRRCAGARRQL